MSRREDSLLQSSMQPGDNRNLVETCSSGTDWLQNMDDLLSCFKTIQDPNTCPQCFFRIWPFPSWRFRWRIARQAKMKLTVCGTKGEINFNRSRNDHQQKYLSLSQVLCAHNQRSASTKKVFFFYAEVVFERLPKLRVSSVLENSKILRINSRSRLT